MHVEVFVLTMKQFEDPGFIELRRLWEEPYSQGPIEFIDKIKHLTAEEHFHGSKHMEIGGSETGQ